MAKFYLLKRDDKAVWYGENHSMVVRATSTEEARKLAALGHEGEKESAWLEEKFSSCMELSCEDPSGIILAYLVDG